MLPEGRLLKVELEVRLPAAATTEQVEEWLQEAVGGCGSIDLTNPLSNFALKPFGPFDLSWRDTGMQGRRETYDHEDLGEGRSRYKVRYLREKA